MTHRQRTKGWSFQRFFIRIFLPLAFVGLVALGMRIYLAREFNERHVRTDVDALDQGYARQPDSTRAPGSLVGVGSQDEARGLSFSEKNRSTFVASLKGSKALLDKSLSAVVGEGTDSSQLVEEAKELKRTLSESIEKLATADEGNWARRRDEAYEVLDAYGEAVGDVRDA